MLFVNARIFTEDGFKEGNFRTEGERFSEIFCDSIPGAGEEVVDLRGAKVIPGLIDVHTHGNSGADVSDGDPEGIRKMAAYSAREGITSFAPATMTLPYEVLDKAFKAAADFCREMPKGHARLLGIQMEGPFFSEKKKGAQNGAYLRLPDFEAFEKLYRDSDGIVRMVDVAAELEGAVEFTEKAKELCTVSIAHSDANYEEASAVFEAGATHLTHLFNAMPPIHHRKPGTIGAASENDKVVAEIICDGFHVHPSSIRMAFKLFPGRICLISDSLRCCGMPDGEYELGGQQIFLNGGVAKLADGTLAGSASNLYKCMLNAIEFGIPEAVAITAATLTPAKEIGREDLVGSIEAGKYADFVVCGEDLERKEVYLGGSKL